MATKLKTDPEHLRAQLDEAIEQGLNLAHSPKDLALLRSGFLSWDKRNEQILAAAFEVAGFLAVGPKDDYMSFMGLTYPFSLDAAETVTIDGIVSDIEKKLERLEVIKSSADAYARTVEEDVSPPSLAGNGIFVIHGRESQARLEIETLILKATDHSPLILQDLANKGSTIIEKLEEHLGKSTKFAVVLLTGDDAGGFAGEEPQPRARQNVILELGYAMGVLGRRNVTIVYQPGVDILSDISGVAYWELDAAGAWKTRVLGDMKAAGLQVNPAALLS